MICYRLQKQMQRFLLTYYNHPSFQLLIQFSATRGWSLTQTNGQPFMLTFAPTTNPESEINLIGKSLDGGRKLEQPQRSHAGTGRRDKHHREPTDGQQVLTRSLLAAGQQ